MKLSQLPVPRKTFSSLEEQGRENTPGNGFRVCPYRRGTKNQILNVVDLINALIKEEAEGKPGASSVNFLRWTPLFWMSWDGLCSLGRSKIGRGPKDLGALSSHKYSL